MVMLPPKGKARKIAEKVMKQKGIELPKKGKSKIVLQTPYLQH